MVHRSVVPASVPLVLRPATVDDADAIWSLEAEAGEGFVIPYPNERHREELTSPAIRYLCLEAEESLVGFLLLGLEDGGRTVEFRRIVIRTKGEGFGTRALTLLEDFCRREWGTERLWLDVFDTNARAIHLYEKHGYQRTGDAEWQGRKLRLYEKRLGGI